MKRNEDNFNENLPAGYDGHFEWDCFKENGCFGNTKIEPMDFDGVVERKYHYLVFETKDDGKDVPQGQQITLDHLRAPKSFTIMKLWPKSPPFTRLEVTHHNGKVEEFFNHDQIIEKIKAWYYWADGSKQPIPCRNGCISPVYKDGLCQTCYDAEQGWESKEG